jgi:hypothetical protein
LKRNGSEFLGWLAGCSRAPAKASLLPLPTCSRHPPDPMSDNSQFDDSADEADKDYCPGAPVIFKTWIKTLLLASLFRKPAFQRVLFLFGSCGEEGKG